MPPRALIEMWGYTVRTERHSTLGEQAFKTQVFGGRTHAEHSGCACHLWTSGECCAEVRRSLMAGDRANCSLGVVRELDSVSAWTSTQGTASLLRSNARSAVGSSQRRYTAAACTWPGICRACEVRKSWKPRERTPSRPARLLTEPFRVGRHGLRVPKYACQKVRLGRVLRTRSDSGSGGNSELRLGLAAAHASRCFPLVYAWAWNYFVEWPLRPRMPVRD